MALFGRKRWGQLILLAHFWFGCSPGREKLKTPTADQHRNSAHHRAAPRARPNPPSTFPSGDGSCAPGCGGACIDKHCLKVLASGQDYPTAIAVSEGNVYWVTDPDRGGAGTVMTVPIDGGPARVIVTAQQSPCGIAVDMLNVYWTNDSSGWVANPNGHDDGSVMKVPISGGTPEVLADHQHHPCAVATDARNVYWRATSTAMNCPIDGGTIVPLFPDRKDSMPVAMDTGGTWLAHDGGAPSFDKSVHARARLSLSSNVATDETGVYWAYWRWRDLNVMWKPVSGGPSSRLNARIGDIPGVRRGYGAVSGIVVDETNVYVLSFEERIFEHILVGEDGQEHIWQYGLSIAKVPVRGGRPEFLVWRAGWESEFHEPGGIAVDETSIYFTDAREGTIMRLTPK
jgi:hypothetical protein